MLRSQPRVHILGLGSIGTFAAHCLAAITSRPPITLLLHRHSLVDNFTRNGRSIQLKTNDGLTDKQTGFDIEFLDKGLWYRKHDSAEPATATNSHIKHLLVCTKTIQTVEALRPLAHRLSSTSTIVILQNGCGIVDELNRTLFRKENERPNYVLGVTSHGVGFDAPFQVTHTGSSAAFFGPVPRVENGSQRSEDPHQYLTNLLCQSTRLNAKALDFVNIFQAQLEKLTVNAFCNPLCGLNSAPNKFLLSLPATRRAILSEISAVFLALPELRGEAKLAERFGVDRLEEMVKGVLHRTAETTCSMVWDLRAGRRTEIDFINGYWCRRGRELGISTPVNDMLLEMVKAKESQARVA